MADKTIAQLPAAAAAHFTDILPKDDQGGAPTQKITLAQVGTLLKQVYYGTTAARDATTPAVDAALWVLSDSVPKGLVSYWDGVQWN